MSDGIPAPSPAKWLEREMDGAAREFYRRLSDGRLATTRCERCARTTFPPRPHCLVCGVEQVWVELPTGGRLHAFTTMETALRFRAPAVLALAEVGGVVVPGIAEGSYDALRIGQEVEIELRPEPETGLNLLAFRAL